MYSASSQNDRRLGWRGELTSTVQLMGLVAAGKLFSRFTECWKWSDPPFHLVWIFPHLKKILKLISIPEHSKYDRSMCFLLKVSLNSFPYFVLFPSLLLQLLPCGNAPLFVWYFIAMSLEASLVIFIVILTSSCKYYIHLERTVDSRFLHFCV